MRKLVIIASLILLLGITIIIVLTSRNTNKNVRSNTIPTPPKVYYPLEPQQLVEKFYQDYDYCMKTPPPAAEGNVSNYCLQQVGPTTRQFMKNIQSEGTAKAGADPVTCSQNPVQKITVDPKVITDETIVHLLVINKQGSLDIPIDVQLTQEDNTWKINTIVCQST